MSREIKVLHLESTDVCQAACPLCARETNHAFDKSQQHHVTIDLISKVLSQNQIQSLDKMFMCGNYGDPAAGRYTMDIYRYFRRINPEITLGMNTNGAIQNTAWWQQLGRIFQGRNDYVVFSIDGLQDTNHIYRKGVVWEKLIENAQAYIKTGASAHWDMLVYRHNEHQVELCEALARKLGFRWFRAKVSKRDLADGLERPIQWQAPTKHDITKISCYALNDQSMYIDAQGKAFACCWLGEHGQDLDFDIVQKTWSSNTPHPVCASACGSPAQGKSVFWQQWKKESQLA